MPPPTDAVVRVTDVSKVYRLYQQPLYRFLDLFGLCPSDGAYYREHQALAGINLEIGRGEKVAIIGRNGAGKSTLLKIITGLVQPTTGSVDVGGRISNLLQIGTGFHPDFTGRQNVFASLAHQGIVGRPAARLFEEIVAFSEIEEYIDQPMKTYSTGMCSRLMFSSSIVMSPDILVVDEILGVGDAYFSHKSFNRMRELCTNAGTTLLLVTHDVYSALNLCERFIWIDRGRAWFDGDGKGAIARYENSIKEQEEQFLRQRSVAIVQDLAAAPVSAPAAVPAPDAVVAADAVTEAAAVSAPLPQAVPEQVVHVLVRSASGFALARPLALAELELVSADGRRVSLDVADGDPAWHLLPESNLSAADVVDGRRSRSIQTHGSIYHKAEWTLRLPAGFDVAAFRAAWHYRSEDPVDVRVLLTNRVVLVRGELTSGEGWQQQTFEADRDHRQELEGLRQIDYGTGAVRITGLEFLDRNGREVGQVMHGDPLTIRMHCRAAGHVPGRRIHFHLGFARQGSSYQSFIHDENLAIPDTERFTIESRLDEVQFGSGTWYVHAGLGVADMFDRQSTPYFSVDALWYHLLTDRLELRVLSKSQFDANGLFVVVPARISVSETPVEPA